VIAVTTVTLAGTLGYAVLFGWPVSDAIYMTVITLTTVGFREVHELVGFPERVWTMLLAVSGVAIIFGSIGIVAETIISEAASGRREAKRMADAVSALRDHYIVCGYGRVGSTVARELLHSGERLVIIDINAASLERASRDGHLVVEGDATDDATLRKAGVVVARGLVTTIDSDANNVYVTLSARAINAKLFIVARANAEGSEAKLTQAGANRVVSPYTMAGRRIAELASRPRVADFIDAALSHGNLSFSLEEVEVDAESPLRGVTVAALRAAGVITLAILQQDGAYEANPPEARALREGESVIASGSTEALSALRARA
jgi:voltage-gated potassium channel